MDKKVMRNISYGLFILTARDGDKLNGCVTNTLQQVTTSPNRISITVNKENYTHDMVLKAGEFNVSILSEDAKFDTFKHFGFQTGRDIDKFEDYPMVLAKNDIPYITDGTNGYISAKVIHSIDLGSHT
ncbi:MAG: flavin reductase, partial [Firmicutes bacterium]|nr:flavin reductase [Bacillota bacterium]